VFPMLGFSLVAAAKPITPQPPVVQHDTTDSKSAAAAAYSLKFEDVDPYYVALPSRRRENNNPLTRRSCVAYANHFADHVLCNLPYNMKDLRDIDQGFEPEDLQDRSAWRDQLHCDYCVVEPDKCRCEQALKVVTVPDPNVIANLNSVAITAGTTPATSIVALQVRPPLECGFLTTSTEIVTKHPISFYVPGILGDCTTFCLTHLWPTPKKAKATSTTEHSVQTAKKTKKTQKVLNAKDPSVQAGMRQEAAAREEQQSEMLDQLLPGTLLPGLSSAFISRLRGQTCVGCLNPCANDYIFQVPWAQEGNETLTTNDLLKAVTKVVHRQAILLFAVLVGLRWLINSNSIRQLHVSEKMHLFLYLLHVHLV
jgi:hypothetical protein